MKTKAYVQKYHLDNPDTANHFNTNLFLEDLNEEFVERINKTIEERKKSDLEFDYRIFQVLVLQMMDKFKAISNKKAGGELRPQLWGAFYAKYIIPQRAKYFPEINAKIEKAWQKRKEKETEEAIINETEN